MANGCADQADVLLRTRRPADAVGATPLHRPEWVAVHEHTKDVYVTLTNGSATKRTGPEPANPVVNSERDPNPYGHIIRGARPAATTPRRASSGTSSSSPATRQYDPTVQGLTGDNIFGSPDGIWVDADGRVWIQTDISNCSQNLASRGYDNIGNNQMLAADPVTGEIRRFLVGPRGCEITGVITTPDQRTMFVNVQHPGESTTFWNNQFGAPTTGNPRTVSNWPDFDPEGRPRPATVVIRRRTAASSAPDTGPPRRRCLVRQLVWRSAWAEERPGGLGGRGRSPALAPRHSLGGAGTLTGMPPRSSNRWAMVLDESAVKSGPARNSSRTAISVAPRPLVVHRICWSASSTS